MTMHAFGDSFTVGVNASFPWPTFIYNVLGTPIANHGVSSSQIADQAASIYAIKAPLQSLWLTGFNDMRHLGATSQPYDASLPALAAWLASTGHVEAQAMTATGTWANTPVYGGTMGRYSDTQGSALVGQTSGTVIYIGCIVNAATMGTIKVSVDGVEMGTWSFGWSSTTGLGANYWPALIAIRGLADGPHTVTITHGGNGRVYIDWIGGNASPSASLVLADCCTMQPASYALGAPTWNHGSDALAAHYQQTIWAVAEQLKNDGLDVRAIANGFDPATQVSSDGVHPADIGQAALARAFLAVL